MRKQEIKKDPPTQKTPAEQQMYDMCSHCIYDYGDFGTFGGKVGKIYRGCRRYIDTGLRLRPKPTADEHGAYCEYFVDREGGGRKKGDIRYGLKPLTVGKGKELYDPKKANSRYGEV